MKPKPIIVVSTMNEKKGAEFNDWSTSLSHWYTRVIAKAGGVPLLAPNLPEKNLARDMVARAEGVMLTGGDDLQPDLYDTKLPKHIKAKAGGVDPKRDLFELLLIKETLKQRKPLLAICRGPQVLNVALGGGLITDIPAERPGGGINHQIKGKAHKLAHTIEIKSGTLMHRIFRRTSIRINSAHHQAVGELAPMLRATAWTRDGIVEAIELVQKDTVGAPFLLGIQFHPERLIDEHPEFLGIFKAFVKACRD